VENEKRRKEGRKRTKEERTTAPGAQKKTRGEARETTDGVDYKREGTEVVTENGGDGEQSKRKKNKKGGRVQNSRQKKRKSKQADGIQEFFTDRKRGKNPEKGRNRARGKVWRKSRGKIKRWKSGKRRGKRDVVGNPGGTYGKKPGAVKVGRDINGEPHIKGGGNGRVGDTGKGKALKCGGKRKKRKSRNSKRGEKKWGRLGRHREKAE